MVQWSRRSHKAYSMGRPIVLLPGALAAAAAAHHIIRTLMRET
jgi:hypothetical protein